MTITEPDDVEAMANLIGALYAQFCSGTLEKYDREYLCRELNYDKLAPKLENIIQNVLLNKSEPVC